MNNEIELAREYAKRGHSFSRTASLLGFWPTQFRDLLEVVGATDIEFVNGHQSLARKKQLADLHASRRGKPAPQTPEQMAARARAQQNGCAINKSKAQHYTAFGVTGTIPDLVKHFETPVSYNSVLRRVQKGMDIEKALTMTAQHLTGSPDHPNQIALRRKARARVQDAIARRLTPTMLKFKSDTHDIIIVTREVPYLTVAICDKNNPTVLHRLKFVAEIASGVLFNFTAEHRERMDFIAFEPDSSALIQ